MLCRAVQYLCIVMIFAALYLALAQDQSCRLNLDTFLDGYYFSLETMVSRPSTCLMFTHPFTFRAISSLTHIHPQSRHGGLAF